MKNHVDCGLSKPDRSNGADGQKWSEGHSGLAAGASESHQQHANNGAEQEAQEQAHGDEARIDPAEVSAEQWRQANIAITHATFARYVDQSHEAKGDSRTEQHHQHAAWFVSNEGRNAQQGNTQRSGDVNDFAGQAFGMQIDPAQSDEASAQCGEGAELPAQIELDCKCNKECRCGELKYHWLDADTCFAAPAFATQKQPTEDGHEITWTEFESATTAGRTRRNNRCATRHAIYNNRQERSDQQSKDRRIGNNHESFTSPLQAAPFRRLAK